MVTAVPKLWTIEELDDLPREGRYEVWSGELVEMPGSGYQHSSIALRIGSSIQRFVEQNTLGHVSGADGGYVIAHEPLTVYVPDVAFVRTGRMSSDEEARPRLVPDLVVEIIPPTDRSSDVTEKIRTYIEAGVAEVWIVHPRQRMVDVYRTGEPNDVRQLHEGDVLEGSELLPGFRLPIADIFPKS